MKIVFLTILFFNFDLFAETPVRELSINSVPKYYREDLPIELIVSFKLNSGWHIYYNPPGKFGLPTELKLQSRSKIRYSKWQYPTPSEFKEITGDITKGYEGQVDFKVEIIPEYNFRRDLTMEVEVTWLACNQEQCVPGEQLLEIQAPYQ